MIKVISRNASFAGEHIRFQHSSNMTACDMTCAVFLPPQIAEGDVPALLWLSGLTCTDQNFMQKAGAMRLAAELGIALVAPDTSPRGHNVPDDPAGSFDLGLGAGFYVNATEHPWRSHYQMYDYIVSELPEILSQNFPIDTDNMALSGHSMGGHGALTIALKNPSRFQSVRFCPHLCSNGLPVGAKSLSGLLG